MRRFPLALAALSLLVAVSPAVATESHHKPKHPKPAPAPKPPGQVPSAPTGVVAYVVDDYVAVRWNAVTNSSVTSLTLYRDGRTLATLARTARGYDDRAVNPGETHSYTLVATAYWGGGKYVSSTPSAAARVTLPAYKVGAAAYDISPDLVGLTVVNQGGNGIGDGHGVSALLGPGDKASPTNVDRIKARAIVVDDGKNVIALATIETQGYFAAYRDGLKGLADMAAAAASTRLPADHILIASDHTHSGPDTIGAWGGMPAKYFQLVYDRTVAAIRDAYTRRVFANVIAGHSDASDLIYNQACPEALYQKPDNNTPAPKGGETAPCATPGKDGLMRVLQARTPSGRAVVTYVAFAAHATAGGGTGITGDWPQYVGDAMAQTYGGVGMAMQGAVGRTQPCRPACVFTKRTNPSFGLSDRKAQITANYLMHVRNAIQTARPVTGAVNAAKGYVREAITGPAVLALFLAGGKGAGARLLRSLDAPWQVGTTVRTVVAALRVGDVLFAGTPGEGYPEIAFGIRDALSGARGPREVITLGLANDQLGYLIAPAWEYAPIAAEAAVNDNVIFNVSPTIGDHVMCADIRLAQAIGFELNTATKSRTATYCAPYNAADLADPLAASPVGGASLDEVKTP